MKNLLISYLLILLYALFPSHEANAQKECASMLDCVVYDDTQQPIKTKLLPYKFYTDTFNGYDFEKKQMDSLYERYEDYPMQIQKISTVLKNKLLFGFFPKNNFLCGYHLLTDEDYRYLIVLVYGHNKSTRNNKIRYHWSHIFRIQPDLNTSVAIPNKKKERDFLPLSLGLVWYGYSPNFVGMFVFPLKTERLRYKGILFSAPKGKMKTRCNRAVIEIAMKFSTSKLKKIRLKTLEANRKLHFFKL